MAVVDFPDKLISFEARKKMGIPNQYGHIVYAVARYGEKNDYAGIYQIRKSPKGRYVVRMKFSVPPETAARIANPRRGIFANAILAWQALDALQKEAFRIKSKSKNMSGYNVFLHEYLISH
jgi:hypothetical protein